MDFIQQIMTQTTLIEFNLIFKATGRVQSTEWLNVETEMAFDDEYMKELGQQLFNMDHPMINWEIMMVSFKALT